MEATTLASVLPPHLDHHTGPGRVAIAVPREPTFSLFSSLLGLWKEPICMFFGEQKCCCFPSGCFVVSVTQTSEKSVFPTQHWAKIDCCLHLIKQHALRLSSNWKTESQKTERMCLLIELHPRNWTAPQGTSREKESRPILNTHKCALAVLMSSRLWGALRLHVMD